MKPGNHDVAYFLPGCVSSAEALALGVQANCVLEIVPPAATRSGEGRPAMTAEVRWAGARHVGAQSVQRAWEHVRARMGATEGTSGEHASLIDDVHLQEALLASSPLFVSISAPEVLADISRVRGLKSLLHNKPWGAVLLLAHVEEHPAFPPSHQEPAYEAHCSWQFSSLRHSFQLNFWHQLCMHCRLTWQRCGMDWTQFCGGRRRLLLKPLPQGTPWRFQQCRLPFCWMLASKPICSMSPRCAFAVSIL